MYTALLFSLLYALISVSANNEFLVPAVVAGIDIASDASVTIEWLCNDCGSSGITLNAWQHMSNGDFVQEKLLGTRVVRFFMRNTKLSSQITFKTQEATTGLRIDLRM